MSTSLPRDIIEGLEKRLHIERQGETVVLRFEAPRVKIEHSGPHANANTLRRELAELLHAVAEYFEAPTPDGALS